VRVRALVDELHARGASVFSAFVPLVLFERGDDGAWETLLGTPVRDLPFDDLNAMLYTSMLQGWSRGLLRRNDARALLHASCVAAHRAFGTRASASLGLVDVGVFGNEPTYRDVRILADDVAIARGAGIDDLALYDLGGVLGRPPAERWLEAFVHTPGLPAPPRRTLRAGIAVRSAGPLGSMIRMTAQAIGRLRSR
jgi:hypothetical protein